MIQKKFYTIYEITNNLNGYTYIGQHSTNKLDDNYMGSGRAITDAYNKYGKSNFTKRILFVYDNFEEMDAKEIELVTREYVLQENTYNMMEGGNVNQGISTNAGYVPVKDKEGVFLFVEVDDTRYVSGELKHVSSGRIRVIDVNGDERCVEPNDPRIKSGEVTIKPKYRSPRQKAIPMNKDGVQKRISERNVPKWEAKGWNQGTVASVTKTTVNDRTRRATIMIKDGKTKQVYLHMVPKWEAKGWVVKEGRQTQTP
jgi:hypothetical protein